MSAELDETAPAARESGPLPTRISKYELGEKLGAGGNGVVLIARDVSLDRKVAIKVLRGDASEAASQRLQREAQAAAKLVHENVIVVHEVGTYDGAVFVAMEYVEGGTLRDLARTGGWRQILDAYVRAGRGLAAAHAAGLVHRDFKPDNVLVGDDGRVRVTDFGLVSVSGTHAVSIGSLDGSMLNTTLTRTGAVMGTPRYMAPEQHAGGAVDERADQFAFCASLYEGLFHRSPFEGDTYDAIAKHVREGAIVPPPTDTPVPRDVRDAVVRGLAPKPEDRWPSMTELLAALVVQPYRRRPRWWLIGAPVVLLAAALIVFFATRHRETVRDAFDRAQAAYEHGDYQAAADGFHHAFELDPDLGARGADYVYDMAGSYEMAGNCPEAVVGYRRYLALGDKLPAAERAKAEDHLRTLADCKPAEDADAAYKEGEAAYNNGDFAAALAAFKRGFALQQHWDKHSAAYLYNAGQAARQLGECADAAAAFKQYLSIRNDVLPERRAQLEKMIATLEDCAAQKAAPPTP